MRKRGRATCQN